jgi:hypothetical protein
VPALDGQPQGVAPTHRFASLLVLGVKATKPKNQMRRVYSQQLIFRRGAESSSTRSVVLYMTGARWAKATKPKNQMRRVYQDPLVTVSSLGMATVRKSLSTTCSCTVPPCISTPNNISSAKGFLIFS